jgi:UPF0755 protein
MYRVLLGILVAASLAVGVIALQIGRWWESPMVLPAEGLILQVQRGDTLGRLSAQLAEQGAIRYPRLFNRFGVMSGADQRIRQGEYRLPPGSTPKSLLALLQSGDTIRYLVTLPEGIRLGDALTLLAQQEALRPILAGPDDPRLHALTAPALLTEGFFLPETYQYERGATDLDVLGEAHRMMRDALEEAWSQRDSSLPYTSPYEVLIMASIIEKETGLASERAQIGGVFVHRLQRGMRLQTDPTVIYGLGDSFDGNLRRVHLRDESNRYNSYRHHGLPPGPIALPGRAALMAAVNPARGDALYFVARGDGSHAFSTTLEEHEAAVRRFQLTRREGYRSSPEARE